MSHPPQESPFHWGELEAQQRQGVAMDRLAEVGGRLIRDYLLDQHSEFYAQLPFIVLGALDDRNRPWVSLMTGCPGFVSTPDDTHVRIQAKPLFGSPLEHQIKLGAEIGILGIMLENRRRNRVNGRVSSLDSEALTLKVTQSFGNCPKYIQTRGIEILDEIAQPRVPRVVTQGSQLDAAGRAMIDKADTLFLATVYQTSSEDKDGHQTHGVDTSHRGGKPGFVRLEDDQTFIFPDFSGNNLFNSVGNMVTNPKTGFLFIDPDTRDLLYLTGQVQIIWDGPEVDAFQGAERLIRFQIDEWRRVAASLPFQFTFDEYSPYTLGTGEW